MKRLFLIIIAVLICQSVNSQDIAGQWNGILEVQGIKLSIVFNIEQSDEVLSSTMDSPDQGAFGIPVTSISFEHPILKIEIANAGIVYTGELQESEIIGEFKQLGQGYPLSLTKDKIETQKTSRPQEPQEPFPYYSEDVFFKNEDANITLAGTLTLPAKSGYFPAVVMITGSGPQNRDEEVFGHKPFLVISDYLTRKGIAVLRFDDRGVAESEGVFQTATTFDFATDVKSAVDFLKTRNEINKKQIGLIGHSEGGIIAPIVASEHSDDVGFIVLLAGTGLRGDKIMLMQQELIGRAMGYSEPELQKNKEINEKAFDIILNTEDDEILKSIMSDYLHENLDDSPSYIPEGMTKDDFIELQLSQIINPWMLNFIKLDPAIYLSKVKCPVLAVNGELDLQVPSKENLEAIKSTIISGGNDNVTTIEFQGLNHLFQECDTGLPSKYAEIEQTFSPLALEEITNWIINQTK